MATQIEPGNYTGKIIDYGITLTKSEKAQVAILFEFNDADGQRHELTWYGSLNEGKAQEITFKALMTCGMKGNDIDALADGVPSGLLDVETPVQLVVERENRTDGKGTFAKIAWINRQGGAAFQAKLARSEAKVKLGALNLKAAMAAARAKEGVSTPPPPTKRAAGQDFNAPPAMPEDDLPF